MVTKSGYLQSAEVNFHQSLVNCTTEIETSELKV